MKVDLGIEKQAIPSELNAGDILIFNDGTKLMLIKDEDGDIKLLNIEELQLLDRYWVSVNNKEGVEDILQDLKEDHDLVFEKLIKSENIELRLI